MYNKQQNLLTNILLIFKNKMENKKYHPVRTFPTFNCKIIERVNTDTLTHKYMTAHFPGLVYGTSIKIVRFN